MITEISAQDDMYQGDKDAYFECGWSALRCIRVSMLAAGKKDLSSILDIPCGHGRVMRTLKAVFPCSTLLACDINRDAVDFCARVFGATPVYSDYSPEAIHISDTVDLIWCGSLMTHLDSFRWTEFLYRFERWLAIGGLLVFTTHGRTMADRLRTVTIRDFVRPVKNVIADYDAYGFAYSDYHDAPREYGVSISSPAWVCGELRKASSLRLVGYTEDGWNASQDVVACVRTPDPTR